MEEILHYIDVKTCFQKNIWIRSGTTDELMQYFFQLCLTSAMAVAKISSHSQFHARYARLGGFNKSSSAHVTRCHQFVRMNFWDWKVMAI